MNLSHTCLMFHYSTSYETNLSQSLALYLLFIHIFVTAHCQAVHTFL